MTPGELDRRLAAIEARLPRGPMVSTTGSATEIRPYQIGLPVELTSSFSQTSGYSWKRLVLDTTVPEIAEVSLPQRGDMAFTPDNDESLQPGQRGWLEADPQAGGWILIVRGGPGADCASIAGLSSSDCLVLTVVTASGACSGIDTSQVVPLVWDGADSRWESTFDFLTTGSGAAGGPVHFFFVNGYPYLTIDGVYLTPLGCVNGGYEFAGTGSVLCGGVHVECADYFVVRLECSCCPASGFTGDGWYCIKTSGVDCATGNKLCVQYTDSVPCSGDVTICSGPYASQALCEASCGGTGGDTGGSVLCCGRNLAAILYASLSGGYGTVTLTWSPRDNYWEGVSVLSCGETLHLRYLTSCSLLFSCDGSTFVGATRLVPSTTCGPPFSDDDWTVHMDNPAAGCAPGACPSLTVDISE